jgi:flagellar biosynthesis anti-sigma factor FlgM
MKISNVGRVINMYQQGSKINKTETEKKTLGDRIEISNTGRDIARYVEIAKNTDVSTSRADDIKRQIKEGTYKIDSEKIAKSLLEAAKDSDL